jgi:hypothetical protein
MTNTGFVFCGPFLVQIRLKSLIIISFTGRRL